MLSSRDLIHNSKLRILIDTAAFSQLVTSGSILPAIILGYQNTESLEYIRTPAEPQSDLLKAVPQYLEEHNESENLEGIKIETRKRSSTIAFGYQAEDIEKVGRLRLSSEALAKDGLKQLTLAFVQAVLQERGYSSIFITDKSILLENRSWLESHFPGVQLNIVTLNEAMEIIDLFLKQKNKFYIAPNYTCNAESFYWFSFRSKLPNFHVEGLDQILNAFASRFNYLLMSLDEIGFKYYSEPNRNSFHQTMYHFNYFISLVTGVLDNVAIKTNESLGLGFSDFKQLSLTNKKFLDALAQKRADIRQHVQSYCHFIWLVHELRNLIIHREMLPSVGYKHKGAMENWEMYLVRITAPIAKCIYQRENKSQKIRQISEWGRYNDGNDSYLEPFRFAKMVTKKLIEFSNEHLKLLGYSVFIHDKNTNKEFAATIQQFQNNKLGF